MSICSTKQVSASSSGASNAPVAWGSNVNFTFTLILLFHLFNSGHDSVDNVHMDSTTQPSIVQQFNYLFHLATGKCIFELSQNELGTLMDE